jgi:fructose 1,6-bisphosphatase
MLINMDKPLKELTKNQEEIIEKATTSLDKANILIDMLRLNPINKYSPDIDLINMMKTYKQEDKVKELYWEIIKECEESGYDLFKNLKCSDLLMDFMY